MPGFADQKAERNVKQATKTFISNLEVVADPMQSVKEALSQMPEKCDTLFTAPAGLYKDFPSSLNIRKDGTKGRGVWSAVAIPQGRTILKTKLSIYGLSNENLSLHCSYCTRSASQDPISTLKRCTKCKQIWYCSSICQKADWQLHKHECSALMQWMSSETSPPHEVVRVLGRILLSRKAATDDNPQWKEIQALQSHRPSFPSSATVPFVQLARTLVNYLGLGSPEELEPYGLHSVTDIVDLISRFTTNSYGLSTPVLTPLGVCLSPAASFFNHSCQPNAAVVFPGSTPTKSYHSQPILNVIALRDLSPDEEVLVSYLDVTFAAPQRQKILEETYNFTCTCPLCSYTTPQLDQREAVLCPKRCGGKCAAPFSDTQRPVWSCSSCDAKYTSTVMDEVKDKRRVGQEAYDKALKFEHSDPKQALKITTNIILLLSNDLPPSAHPYLNILRLHQALLIQKMANSDPTVLDDTIRTISLVVAGSNAILEKGHPILSIALAELGQLLAVDEPAYSKSIDITAASSDYPPRGPRRLALALEISKRALENLMICSGRENEGGEIGIQIRESIVKLEREAQVWNYGIRNVLKDTILQEQKS